MSDCIHQMTEYVGEGEWVCNECKTYFDTEERLWVLVGNQQARIEELDAGLKDEYNRSEDSLVKLEARIEKCQEANGRQYTMIEERDARIDALTAGLEEAMDWNWLDDDVPDDIALRLAALLEVDDESTR